MRSNLVAYLALFAALGGTGYAASGALLPTNSVGSAQVIDHSLKRQDFRRGTLLSGPRGQTGLRGLRGPAGKRGRAGPAGPAGSAGTPLLSVTTVTTFMGGLTGTSGRAAATCPAGTSVVGGGYVIPPNVRQDLDIRVPESRATPMASDPSPGMPPNSWVVSAYVRNPSPVRGVDALPVVYVVARCAKIDIQP